MKTTTNPGSDALALAHGRVPARPDLDSLADLLTAYRSAALGTAPRLSAALSARVDLTATPIAMQRDLTAVGDTPGAGTRRAVGGLFGLGVTVAIILGAASGAAAVVSMGTAGLLPPGAQGVFDQVVSDIAPLGVVGEETTDQEEAPGVPTDSATTAPEPSPEPTEATPGTIAVDPDEDEDADSVDGNGNGNGTGNGTGNSGINNGVGSGGQDNGFGNSGDGNGNGNGADNENKNEDKKEDKKDGKKDGKKDD